MTKIVHIIHIVHNLSWGKLCLFSFEKTCGMMVAERKAGELSHEKQSGIKSDNGGR